MEKKLQNIYENLKLKFYETKSFESIFQWRISQPLNNLEIDL